MTKLSLSLSLSRSVAFAILLIQNALSCRKDQDHISSSVKKSSYKSNDSDKYSSNPSQTASVHSDDEDDFDPRGTSTTSMYI